MKKFKGFTLTELMVSLAVIGVIVAVVTPAIMKSRPNKVKMMIKKTFYTTEQIVSTLINDSSLYPDKRDVCPGDGCKWGFDDTSNVTYYGSSYSGDYKFGALFKENLNVKNDVASSKISNKGPDEGDFYPKFMTSDGVIWDLTGTSNAWSTESKVGTFDNANASGSKIGTILIDVNGSEDPNCREAETSKGCSADDFDQYQIQILANGKLRINPADAKASDYATIGTSIND